MKVGVLVKHEKSLFESIIVIFLAFTQMCGLLFSQKTIVKAAKKYGIPCIIHVQDVYPESLTN